MVTYFHVGTPWRFLEMYTNIIKKIIGVVGNWNSLRNYLFFNYTGKGVPRRGVLGVQPSLSRNFCKFRKKGMLMHTKTIN